MRGKWHGRGRWLGRLGAIALGGPLVAGEVWHFARHGHLGAGLHADAIYAAARDFGIPGVSGAYSVQLVNLTPIPIPARTCRLSSDTSFEPPPLFRYEIERWEDRQSDWVEVLTLPPGDCGPLPVVWTVLWPGIPVTAVEWEATAARAGLHKGDRVRFKVFRDFGAPDGALLQLTAASRAVVMTEECTDPDTTYRVRH